MSSLFTVPYLSHLTSIATLKLRGVITLSYPKIFHFSSSSFGMIEVMLPRVLLLLLCLGLFPSTLFAQGVGSLNNIADLAVSISLSPAFPEPNEPVTARLENLLGPRAGAAITWQFDGETLPEVANERSIEVFSPGLRETSVVTAILTLPDGRVERVSATIAPIYLDIIVEPQTHVPSFYTGRPLPTTGSTVNVTALLFGVEGDPQDLIYTWRVNNQAINGGGVRGGFKSNFTMPLDFEVLLSVEVSSPTGQVLGRSSTLLINAEPELHFYEDHILYGLQPLSLRNRFLSSNTINVVAAPYYLDSRVYNDPDVIEWEIDGQDIARPSGNPYQLTISTDGSVGSSRIGFRVQSTTRFLQGVRDSIQVFY